MADEQALQQEYQDYLDYQDYIKSQGSPAPDVDPYAGQKISNPPSAGFLETLLSPSRAADKIKGGILGLASLASSLRDRTSKGMARGNSLPYSLFEAALQPAAEQITTRPAAETVYKAGALVPGAKPVMDAGLLAVSAARGREIPDEVKGLVAETGQQWGDEIQGQFLIPAGLGAAGAGLGRAIKGSGNILNSADRAKNLRSFVTTDTKYSNLDAARGKMPIDAAMKAAGSGIVDDPALLKSKTPYTDIYKKIDGVPDASGVSRGGLIQKAGDDLGNTVKELPGKAKIADIDPRNILKADENLTGAADNAASNVAKTEFEKLAKDALGDEYKTFVEARDALEKGVSSDPLTPHPGARVHFGEDTNSYVKYKTALRDRENLLAKQSRAAADTEAGVKNPRRFTEREATRLAQAEKVIEETNSEIQSGLEITAERLEKQVLDTPLTAEQVHKYQGSYDSRAHFESKSANPSESIQAYESLAHNARELLPSLAGTPEQAAAVASAKERWRGLKTLRDAVTDKAKAEEFVPNQSNTEMLNVGIGNWGKPNVRFNQRSITPNMVEGRRLLKKALGQTLPQQVGGLLQSTPDLGGPMAMGGVAMQEAQQPMPEAIPFPRTAQAVEQIPEGYIKRMQTLVAHQTAESLGGVSPETVQAGQAVAAKATSDTVRVLTQGSPEDRKVLAHSQAAMIPGLFQQTPGAYPSELDSTILTSIDGEHHLNATLEGLYSGLVPSGLAFDQLQELNTKKLARVLFRPGQPIAPPQMAQPKPDVSELVDSFTSSQGASREPSY